MAVRTGGPAPYAPPAAILALIQRFRARGFQPPFNLELLVRAGVTDSLAPRVLQSLRLLDLIDDAGNATPEFEGLRRAPEPEFKPRLAAIIRAAYADVFTFIDPMVDSPDAVKDAFRSFEPLGQLRRMVTLFLGLCAAADLAAANVVRPPREPSSRRPNPTKLPGGSVRVSPRLKTTPGGFSGAPPGLPAPLAGLLADLPSHGGGWTAVERDRFVKQFAATLEYCYPERAINDGDEGEE